MKKPKTLPVLVGITLLVFASLFYKIDRDQHRARRYERDIAQLQIRLAHASQMAEYWCLGASGITKDTQ